MGHIPDRVFFGWYDPRKVAAYEVPHLVVVNPRLTEDPLVPRLKNKAFCFGLFVLLVTSSRTFGQAFADGSFEQQAPGNVFTAPWLESNGSQSFVNNVPQLGFPTQGIKFARVASDFTGSYTLNCTQHPTYSGGWVNQLFGGCENVTSISFDWTWFCAELPNQPTYNDFMSIRLYDGNGTLLATMVYVDTRDGNGTLQPACAATGVSYPFSFVNGEVSPAGPKHVTLNMASVAGYVPGMALDLVILVANRGDATTNGYGLVDNIVVTSTQMTGSGQANSVHGRMEINGAGGGTCPGPFTLNIPGNSTANFTMRGDPGQPFAVFVSAAQHAAGTSFSCFGELNIGTAPNFFDLLVLVDGTVPGSPFQLDANGQVVFLGTVPPGPFDLNLQGVVFRAPGSSCAVTMTAAIFAHIL